MKKIFLFAAATVAAMTMNAAVWEFKTDTINTVEAVNAKASNTTFTLTQKTSSDNQPYVAVDYSNMSGADAELYFTDAPIEVKFTYKNSGDKTECLKLYNSYLQINRKGVIMTIYCMPGDDIIITPKSYSKACEFAVTGADKAVVAFEKNSETPIALKATDSEVVFDSSAPSDASAYAQACQFVSIQVGASTQAIDNVKDAVKAEKFYRDGQLIIRKNNVEYNVLGAQL